MTPGPIEFFLLAFPGTQNHAGVVTALERAQRLTDVRIIDALLVTRAADGTIDAAELSDVDALTVLAANLNLTGGPTADDEESLVGIDADDAEEIGAAMEPNSTALAMLVEHVWADDLAEAIRAAGGGVVAAVRIPRTGLDDEYEVDEVDEELELSVEPSR